jgi:hypothetical protein
MRGLKLLAAAQMKDLALPLYIDAARSLTEEAQVNALGETAVETGRRRRRVPSGSARRPGAGASCAGRAGHGRAVRNRRSASTSMPPAR